MINSLINFKQWFIARLSCISVLLNGYSLQQYMTNSFLPFKEESIAIYCGIDIDADPEMPACNNQRLHVEKNSDGTLSNGVQKR